MATITDVARRAGVSVGTVSHVINNTVPVKRETRDRVLGAIRELDYHPNLVARSLQSRKTNTISLVLPATERNLGEHSYLSELLAGITDESRHHSFDLLLSTSCAEDEELSIYRRMVRGKRVDGCIITCTKENDERIAYFLEENMPFVAFGRSNEEWGFPYVDVDGKAGVQQGVRYLIDLGHRRIGFMGLPLELMCSRHRLKGYRAALEEEGLIFDPGLVTEGKASQPGGYQAMKRLLEVELQPTAIMTSSDLMALGAMKAASEKGLSVGGDISIVGFDDIQLAANYHPPLTTIRQPTYKIGVTLCHMLIQLIRGEELIERQIILQPELVVRESCGRRG